jgi:hypothetical protein
MFHLAKNCSYTEGKGVVSVNALNPWCTCHRTEQVPISVSKTDGISMNRMIEIVLSRPEMSRVKTTKVF